MMTTEQDRQAPENFRQSRVRAVAEARALCHKMWTDGEARRQQQVRLRAQLEGGRPWDAKKLEERGESWRSNHNFGDARAMKDRARTSYWQMTHNVPTLVSVTVKSRAPQGEAWARVMADAFEAFHHRWGEDFIVQDFALIDDFITYGWAGFTFTDPFSPRWEHIPHGDWLFPKDCPISQSKWDMVGLRRETSISDLWNRIRTKEQAKDAEQAGWNVKAIRQFLIRLRQETQGMAQGDDWNRLQDELIQNDLGASTAFGSNARLYYLFVREWTGKISLRIMPESIHGVEGQSEKEDYLFESEAVADAWSQVIGLIFYDIGNKKVHGVKGFAWRNHGHAMLINRLRNRLVDQANFNSGLNFARNGPAEGSARPVVENYAGFNVFPQGLTQITTYAPMQPAMDVMSMLERNQAENNAIYREQSQQIKETETATQANILANIASQVDEAQGSLYLSQKGRVQYAEVFRRLRANTSDEDAQAFRAYCLEYGRDFGLSAEVLDSVEVEVQSSASPSLASPFAREQAWTKTLALRNEPGMNRRWIMAQYVASVHGAQAVAKILPPEDRPMSASSQRMAMMENLAMGDLAAMPVDEMDDHVMHTELHMQPVEAAVQHFVQTGQGDPQRLTVGQLALEHIRQHLQMLELDSTKKEVLRELVRRFQAAVSVFEGMMRRMEKEQQQNGMGQQMGRMG